MVVMAQVSFRMLLLTTFLLAIATASMAADNSALVANLPGLTFKPTFRQYSGYLRASSTHQLHYWFVESQSNPAADPLVVWFNGGPGCSSLDGLLSEHGPFLIQDNNSLVANPYAWNRRANVIYLESPAGVGFSYSSDGNVATNDIQVAAENFEALKDFLLKFPEFRANDFYITGESYGGIYVPTLTALILKEPSFKLKGIAVGNGLSSFLYNEVSAIYFSYYHGLFGASLWDALHKDCNCQNQYPCFFPNVTSAACQRDVVSAAAAVSGLDIYNIYAPCYHPKGAKRPMRSRAGRLFRSKSFQQLRETPSCINDKAATFYLNQPAVRNALHIPSFVQPWMICSDKVEANYTTVYSEVSAIYREILNSKTRVLIYNGDVDMACNFLGDEWFFDALNYPLDYSLRKWFLPSKIGDQVGGVSKSFKNGQLIFTTIRGSGHMVPSDRPQAAYHMIDSFLRHQPL